MCEPICLLFGILNEALPSGRGMGLSVSLAGGQPYSQYNLATPPPSHGGRHIPPASELASVNRSV